MKLKMAILFFCNKLFVLFYFLQCLGIIKYKGKDFNTSKIIKISTNFDAQLRICLKESNQHNKKAICMKIFIAEYAQCSTLCVETLKYGNNQ